MPAETRILFSFPARLPPLPTPFSPETPTLPRVFCAASSAARAERSETASLLRGSAIANGPFGAHHTLPHQGASGETLRSWNIYAAMIFNPRLAAFRFTD